jgi:hypothetical protein
MTIETYLAAISYGAVAVSLTAISGAVSAVVTYYSYKWAAGLIKNHTKHTTKLKKHKMFYADRPAISMVKAERNGKIKVKA